MLKAIVGLFESRKMKIAVAAAVAFILIRYFKLGEEQSALIADKLVDLAMVLIGTIAAEDVAAKLKLGVSNPASVLEALKAAGKKGK